MLEKHIKKKKMLVIYRNKIRKNKIRTKMIKMLIVFPENDAKFDNLS